MNDHPYALEQGIEAIAVGRDKAYGHFGLYLPEI
jgi:hypothetical protein